MAATFRNAHAVVIGVGGDLPVTVTDAEGIARILRDPDRCAVPQENVRLRDPAKSFMRSEAVLACAGGRGRGGGWRRRCWAGRPGAGG